MTDRIHSLDEPERLAAIAASDLLDTGAIPALDRLVRTVARLLAVPVVQLNVITADRQIPVSHVGGDHWGRSVDLGNSFCQDAIRTGEPLVVEDARQHPLLAGSPATRQGGIVAYLSVPILSPRATAPLATLCVVDFQPRAWTEAQVETLRDLAAWARSEIELRAERRRERLRAEEVLQTTETHLRAIYDGTYEYIGLISPGGRVLDCNRASLEFAGNRREDVVGEYFWDTPWFAYTPGAPEALREAVKRAAGGEFVRSELTLQRPSGDALTFDFSLHPIRDASGRVTLIVPEGRDVTQRVRTGAALRESEERYRSLFESIDDGFCVIEMIFEGDRPVDYRFLEANPAFVAQTGLQDAVGRRMRELVPGHEAHWFERYGRVARTGIPDRFEAPAEGLGRWYEAYAFRVGPAEDARVAVLFRDVTRTRLGEAERERLLAELAVERKRLTEVIRRIPAPMAVLRGRGYVAELVNDAYLQLVGHREIMGKPLFDAVPEAAGQGFEELLEQVLDTGEPFIGRDIPVQLRHTPDAPLEERIFDLTYVPLTEVDGTRSGIVALGIDVTERTNSRREVERARDRAEQLQALTGAMAAARTVDDVAEVVVADLVAALGARTGSLAVRGSDGESLVLLRAVGMTEPILETLRRQPLDRPIPLAACYRTRTPIWIERRDGPDGLDTLYPAMSAVWDEVGLGSAVFMPLMAAGEPAGVVSFGFAEPGVFPPEERSYLLTIGQQAALAVERARLFEAEREARGEAERANRAKSDFLAVMSHELRTPLNAIAGYAELMEMGIRGPVSPEQHKDLARIQQSQRHLLGLINEVLNYARLETGTVHFEIGPVSMAEAIAGAEALVEPQARGKKLSLHVNPCSGDLTALADAEKVRQILVNLLSNAVKFTPPGGRVELSCSGSAEEVQVIVRDTGLGIPPDHLERIFEPFVQVRAELTRTAEGTGLGLAISRDLARRMGGDLIVESEPGVGSAFTLRLKGV